MAPERPSRGSLLRRGLIGLTAAALAAAAFTAAPAASAATAHGGGSHGTAANPKHRKTATASLSSLFTDVGISDDANPGAADLDGDGYSFSGEALAAVGWAPGATLPLADGANVQVPDLPPGTADNALASGQTFADPGTGAALDFVVTGTDGQTDGTGTITYADGSTQTYSLTAPDWFEGTASSAAASAAYRNAPGGPQDHEVSLFTDPVPLAAGETVATVTLPDVGTSTAGTAAMHVFATAFAPVSGPGGLSAAFDDVGISDDGDPTAADIDGTGHSLSAEDLAADGWTPGAALTLDGTPLRWPNVAPGAPDNVVADGQRIAVGGSGDALTFVVASTAGATTGTGTVTYADGSTQTFTLSNGDWYTGPTDSMAVQLPDWNTPTGTQSAAVKLTPDTVPIDPAKQLAAVTLPAISATPGPDTPALHVFALGVRPSAGEWRGTWAAAADDGIVNGPWTARTLRMVEHTSVGGNLVRIRLDNDFNTAPVVIGHATVAVQASGADATAVPVTLAFDGNQGVTIPAGGQAVSDAVPFTVPADTNLLVSLYLPGPVALAPFHSLGMQDMYSTADQAGDQTADTTGFPVNNTFGFWTLLSGVNVIGGADPGSGSIVAFGDSITDGYGSTSDANSRWPNDLARRLLDQTQYPQMSVVDEGISGNRVVSDDFTGLAGTGTGGISALAGCRATSSPNPGCAR